MLRLTASVAILACSCATLLAGPSVFEQRPPDAQAVDLAAPQFAVHADGVGDDAPPLQAAIDLVHASSPTRRGIVFVRSGTYRLGTTVNVWRGVRVIGYGKQRPVFLLGASTPGFQGPDAKHVFFFAFDKPREGERLRDGGASGFFAALQNADIEIAEGNPAAVGVRFNVAQHSFLADVELRLGSAKAGVEAAGNYFHRCTFVGGQYGIVTHRTAPGWPFLLVDSTFVGQRAAAILTDEAGMTIVRGQFRDTPRAIEVTEKRPEQLWVKDSLFERIGGAAITLSSAANARTQASLQNVLCRDVLLLLTLRETGKNVHGPGASYIVKDLVHGLQSAGLGGEAEIKTTAQFAPLPSDASLPPSDVPALPPVAEWADARALGAKGDGATDDATALQSAVDTHRVVYLPTGRYLLSTTLRLRPDSVLIGLHPATTQLVATASSGAFEGEGPAVPLLATARGGSAIVSGLGIDTGSSPRAAGVEWRAGAQSLVNDVNFPDPPFLRVERTDTSLPRAERPNNDPRALWDSQSHSLWIRDGGGGTFANIWTVNTNARSGLYISDTETSGRVYALSDEHHVHREVRIERVANWSFYGLQTEAEGDSGSNALPIEIRDSRDLLFANLFMYRVSRTRTPYPMAIETTNCQNVVFRGLRVFSPTKFAYDNSIKDRTTGRSESGREWASLTVDRTPVSARKSALAVEVKPLATVFESIDSLVVTPAGALCFVDSRQGRIYEWRPETGARLLAESPFRPATLAADPQTGALFVVSRNGNVFTLGKTPGEAADLKSLRHLKRSEIPSNIRWVRPTSVYWPDHFMETATQQSEEVWSLDSVAIAADKSYRPYNDRPQAWTFIPVARSYGLELARPGHDFFMADEYRHTTYRFSVRADGVLEKPQVFAEIGEADVVQGADGHVYIAAGDLFVFDKDGRKLARIPFPERPQSLAFSRSDPRTLYVAARTTLYSVRLPRP